MLCSPDLIGSKKFPLYIKLEGRISVSVLYHVNSIDSVKEFLLKAANFQILNMLTNSW